MSDTCPRSRQQNQKYWQKHIAAWGQSAMTQKEYCRTHGLSPSSFSYWRNKFNKRSDKQAQFYPLTVQAEPPHQPSDATTDTLHLFVNDRRFCLAIDRGFNEQVLRRLILALEVM